VVVSVAEKAGPDPAVVCLGETSESKPSMNGRKGIVDVETEVCGHLGTSLGGALKSGPGGIRLEGGVTKARRATRPFIFGERHLRRALTEYITYFNQ
jgi:hypothetical protein